MSLADPFAVIVLKETSDSPNGDPAPRHAMKVVLQTLRQRCTKLQSRISQLEEENLYLRSSLYTNSDSMKASGNRKDEEREGENIWAHHTGSRDRALSSPRNTSVSSKERTDIFPTIKPVSPSVLKHDSVKIKEDSLEEISLRDGALARSSSSSKEDESDGTSEDNLESLDLALKEIVKKMKKDQDVLRQQQEGLKSALELFRKLIKENSLCKSCLKREEGAKRKDNKAQSSEEGDVYRARERIRVPIPSGDAGVLLPLKDRICPLCEKYFHCSTPFEEFNDHVLSHFVEDEEEVSGNFEVVT